MSEKKVIPINCLHYGTLNVLRLILHLNDNILCQTMFMENTLNKINEEFNKNQKKEIFENNNKEEPILFDLNKKITNHFSVYEEFLKLKNSYNGNHFFKVYYRQSKK